MISATRISRLFNKDKYAKIPEYILERARLFGKAFGEMIYAKLYGFEVEEPVIDRIYEELKDKDILDYEVEYKDEDFHGFVDIDCKDCFVEVKCRRNYEIDIDMVVQVGLYEYLTKKHGLLLIFNKTKNDYKIFELTDEQRSQARDIIEHLKAINKYFKEGE